MCLNYYCYTALCREYLLKLSELINILLTNINECLYLYFGNTVLLT